MMHQQQTVQQIMTDSVISVSPNQTIEEAARLMNENNIGAIPVVENNQVVGMVTDRDITIRSTADGGNEKQPVSQVMTNEIISVTPETQVEEAASLMAENQIRRLPVIENNQIVGMVSLGDIATEEQFDSEAEEALTNISKPSRPQH